jgi:hypothetical protein
MTIFGFITLILLSAFRLGLSAWERGETTREEYQKLRTVSQLISRQIKSIVPYRIKTQKAEGDYLAFEGKPNSLRFVSALSLRAKQPEGFVYAIYEFEEGGRDGGRLVLYEQRVLNKDFFEETPKEETSLILLEGISGVSFEYYREEDPEKDRTEGWFDEWNTKEEKELPKAFKMTVTYQNGKNEKEEIPLTLMATIKANRYEEVRTGPTRFRGFMPVQERLQRGGN